MDRQLTGRVALVAGSTAGIGFATARSLAREGAHVCLNGRTQARVDSAISAIRSEIEAAKVDGIAADFADTSGAETVIAKLPVVDVLMNNVGNFESKPFAEISDSDGSLFCQACRMPRFSPGSKLRSPSVVRCGSGIHFRRLSIA
jgi:short-subunit dehydrogenase